jgi:hypothetical protein
MNLFSLGIALNLSPFSMAQYKINDSGKEILYLVKRASDGFEILEIYFENNLYCSDFSKDMQYVLDTVGIDKNLNVWHPIGYEPYPEGK